MQGVTDAQSSWLKARVTQLPRGTNTVLMTHVPNMARAFPQWTSGLADGETLVFGHDSSGAAVVVARIKIEDWPKLRP